MFRLTSLDPVALLPTEISAHILSYLDPASLLNSELVSRDWLQASSSYVWKNVFRGAYEQRPPSQTKSKLKQSSGLGKNIPNQNWKRMYLVRRALDERWKNGKAAAIYLQGHEDSVYCSQFDEYVLAFIRFSRDATNPPVGKKSSLVPVIARFVCGMLSTRGHVRRSLDHPPARAPPAVVVQ